LSEYFAKMNLFRTPTPRTRARLLGVAAIATALVVTLPTAANAVPPYPSDSTPPNLITLLSGYNSYWVSDGSNDLHGTVKNAAVLERDDQLTVWINQHATKAEKFLALQDSEYQNATNTAYDQSLTVATGLGSRLSKVYIKGRNSGALPLTTALINSSNGTAGAYVGTSAAKTNFSHPRPYLPSDPTATAVAGDAAGCAPSAANASSQQALRVSRSYADAAGNLLIKRVATVTDTTHQFSPNDVVLDAGYGTTGICLGGSFPSGHTTTAFQAGITLATLVPQLAPEILTRASENGNNRIVLGVHYPLDIMGGRIDGEAALATRWSDVQYRTEVLEPAQAEFYAYVHKTTGHTVAWNITHQKAYSSNPYAGKKIPGGTAQIVTNRKSAVKVYTERLTYGFAKVGTVGLPASVPAGASNLLLTTFPKLTDTQRASILAQTEIASGYPLDQTGSADGSWERLNLAAAMSASVTVSKTGAVKVVSTGGTAKVTTVRAHK
jgi:membrane-associated phospholipid phosphatase